MWRPLFIAALLAVAQVAVLYIERGYTFGEVVPPTRDLAELPAVFGPWKGESQEVSDQLKDFLQRRAGTDRVYRNTMGGAVSAHVIWTDDYIRVHFPDQCYRQSGWDQVGSAHIDIETASGERFPARLLTFKQDEQEIQVLYWFQMGDEMFFDRIQHRTLRRKLCWGNREWPPLVKVMLQSSGRRSEDHLRDLAEQIQGWMQQG